MFKQSIKITWHVEMELWDLQDALAAISQEFSVGFTVKEGSAIYDGTMSYTTQVEHVMPRHDGIAFKDIERSAHWLAAQVQESIRERTNQWCTMPVIEAAEYLCTCDTRGQEPTCTFPDTHKGQAGNQVAYR